MCTPEALLQSDDPFSGGGVEFDSKEVLGSPRSLGEPPYGRSVFAYSPLEGYLSWRQDTCGTSRDAETLNPEYTRGNHLPQIRPSKSFSFPEAGPSCFVFTET